MPNLSHLILYLFYYYLNIVQCNTYVQIKHQLQKITTYRAYYFIQITCYKIGVTISFWPCSHILHFPVVQRPRVSSLSCCSISLSLLSCFSLSLSPPQRQTPLFSSLSSSLHLVFSGL